MKNILVADVMTRDPVIIKPDTNLLECAKKMVRKRVGSLLIVQNKKLVGFLSEKRHPLGTNKEIKKTIFLR